MSPKLSPSLAKLRDEIDKRWPNRPKQHDGWIGDSSHAARKSDHNPDSRGIVHAIDVTVSDSDTGKAVKKALMAAAIGDHRVWYVIHDGFIYSKTHNWAKRRYTGPNPHRTHIHVSGDYNRVDENDKSGWGILSVNLPGGRIHIVKAGDTLSSIAKKYNTTWEEIFKDNAKAIGTNPNILTVGTSLKIGNN